MRTLFSLIALLFLAGSSFAATTYLGVECDTNGAVVFPTNFFTGNSFGAAGALTNLDTRGWTNNTGIYGNGVGLTNVPVTLPSGVLTNNYSEGVTITNAAANTFWNFNTNTAGTTQVVGGFYSNGVPKFTVTANGGLNVTNIRSSGLTNTGRFYTGQALDSYRTPIQFGTAVATATPDQVLFGSYSNNFPSMIFNGPGVNFVGLGGGTSTASTDASIGAIASYGQSWPAAEPTFTFIIKGTNYVTKDVRVGGTLTATNGVQLMLKPSFTTNFTCTTNLQVYACNGTNQLVTLPNAAYVPNVIYRFAVTNGWAKVVITNATGAQTIRDGTSLSFTQIGIGSPAFFSDGAQWWSAARTKVVMPNAQFSTSTNIPLTLATTSYPVTFNNVDFDFSQGISLAAGTNGLNSKMWITNSGQYEFSPSIVINFNGNNTVTTWFKKDDVNIPNSATAIKGAAGGSIRCVTIPFVVSVTNAAAFEIWVQSTGTGDQLFIQAASGAAMSEAVSLIGSSPVSSSSPPSFFGAYLTSDSSPKFCTT